jgi:hypothetical protein
MSEQEQMDRWLHEALSAQPQPGLTLAFDRRIAEAIRPRRLSSRGRIIMAVYSVAAMGASIWTMRIASIDWSLIAVSLAIPMLLVAALGVRRSMMAR